jgi:hypothetical protein
MVVFLAQLFVGLEADEVLWVQKFGSDNLYDPKMVVMVVEKMMVMVVVGSTSSRVVLAVAGVMLQCD